MAEQENVTKQADQESAEGTQDAQYTIPQGVSNISGMIVLILGVILGVVGIITGTYLIMKYHAAAKLVGGEFIAAGVFIALVSIGMAKVIDVLCVIANKD